MTKVRYIPLRAKACSCASKGRIFLPSSSFEGWQEDIVLRVDQMKFSPSVMVRGGMTGHGLTDLHFVSQEMKINSDYYIHNILEKIVKPAFNDNVVQRNLFHQLNLKLFQQDGARCHTSFKSIRWLDKAFLLTFAQRLAPRVS